MIDALLLWLAGVADSFGGFRLRQRDRMAALGFRVEDWLADFADRAGWWLDGLGLRIRLALINYGEPVMAGALAAVLLMLYALSCMGCASCPPPEVVTVPQVIEVPVPVQGEPLAVCLEPRYEVCNQATDRGQVLCIGRNHQALVVCHRQNVDTIESHNLALVPSHD